MYRFGVICEGPTDFAILKRILTGFFKDAVVNAIQPPLDAPGPDAEQGGWTLVFRALEEGRQGEALAFNDYVVVHLDTDVSEDKGYDVPHREDGQELALAVLTERVRERILRSMKSEFLDANREKVLFAIAVESIECWLLPLHHDDARAAKTTGCIAAVNEARKRDNKAGIASTDPLKPKKFVAMYEDAAKPFRKRKTLEDAAAANPSLGAFVAQLAALPDVTSGTDIT